MGKLLDEGRFKHVSYHDTNLQRTFARVRAQLKDEQKARVAKDDEAVQRLHVLYPKLKEA